MISFVVPGRAQTSGNKSAFPFKRKDGSLGVNVREGRSKEANERVQAWRALVSLAAPKQETLLDGALTLEARFYFQRPAGHFGDVGTLNKKGRGLPYPTGRPDLSKLVRCLEDSLKGILWTDDARIVRQVATKRWGERDEVEIHVSPEKEP